MAGIKLKPCPFCGGEVGAFFIGETGTEYRFEGYDIDGDVHPYIHCYGCDSEWFSDLDDVIEAWNRRTHETQTTVNQYGSNCTFFHGNIKNLTL